MKFQIREQAAKVLSKRKKHSIYVLSVSIAAVFTVVGVVYGLTRPGRAFSSLQKTLECNAQAHTHTAECYDAEGNLICGMADYFAHVHDPELCYDENGDLVCPLPEIIPHEHDDSCYIERLELICGIEEGQVVDRNGNPVFDEAGNPLFDINAVPEIGSIEILGTVEDVTEAEVTEETDANQEVTEDGDNLEAAGETSEEAPAADVTEKAAENGDSNAPAPDETPAEGTPAEETPTEDAATDETTDQETPAESTTPDIIEETVDLGGAGADIAEGGYTTHVHTADCYRVERELVCTIPALHVHTADCYDEDGKLICGQLQLSQHVHGEDCFVYEEKTVTKTAVAGDYTITATYGASAKIPSKAELRAYIVQPDTEAYNNDLELTKQTAGEDAEVEAIINIGFYLGDKEYEPEGPVDVKITLNKENFSTGDDVTILHIKDDNSVETLESTVDESNATTISTDSFSDFVILEGETRMYILVKDCKKLYLNEKCGKNFNIYGINESFENSAALERFRSTNNELGIAGNFHMVALNDYYGCHMYGNVAAKNLTGLQGDIGTDGWDYELSYFQNVSVPTLGTGEFGTQKDTHAVVFGYSVASNLNNLLTIDDQNYHEGQDDNREIWMFSQKLVGPYNVYFEIDPSTPFINFDNVRQTVEAQMSSFASVGDKSVEYKVVYEGDGINVRSGSLTITDPDACAYFNIDAKKFQDTFKERNFRVQGFKKGHLGSLVVNVDCSTIPLVDGVRTFVMPQCEAYYGIEGVSPSNEIEAFGIGEVSEFSTGKIIYNFYNDDQYPLTIECGKQHNAIILATHSKVHLKGGTLQGQVIAYDIVNEEETHRATFTGTTIPVSAEIVFHKTVNGINPDGTQKFDFILQEYKDGGWTDLQTVSNVGKNIVFEDISYDANSRLVDHWYRIIEKAGSAKDNKQYFYDNNCFIMKVHLYRDGINLKADKTYYNVVGEPTFTVGSDGIPLALTNGKVISDVNKLTFDNTPKFTKITVTKKWVDYKGKDLVDDLPESLKVNLYRSKEIEGAAFNVTGLTPIETVELNAANNWTYTWDELLTKDEADGKKFVYFVTEADTVGFEAVRRSYDSWFIQGTQEFVNKKNLENTYIEIDKQFFGFDLNGEKTLLNNPDPKKDPDPDAYIKVRLDQVEVDADGKEIGTAIPYSGSCKISGNATTITDGVFKITARDGWKMKIDELPKVVVDKNGNISYYKYLVTELECSLGYGVDGEPICRGTEEKDTDGKVFTLFTLKNILLPTELEIDKKWFTYLGTPDSLQTSDTTDVTIDVGLSRVDKKGNAEEIGTITVGALSYKVSAKAVNQAFEVTGVTENNAPKKWAVKVTKLPAYYVATDADGKTYLEKYSYKVSEKAISISDYTLVDLAISDGENNIIIPGSVLNSTLKEDDGTYSTIVINNRSTSTFQLPETGGRGRNFTAFYIVGALMLLGSVALLIYRKRL